MFKVPVLFIIYNRIEETHNVFQILRTIRPERLYVAGDGCRDNQQMDRLHTYQTRAVIQPEWPCQLHTRWEAEYIGKSEMINRAMSWFFENEEEGIVLFEDTLPGHEFFPYCEEMLDKYRDDEHIFSIGGSYSRKRIRKRYLRRLRSGKGSKFFSAYTTMWGFATWKKKWLDFPFTMDRSENHNISRIIAPYMKKQKRRLYWLGRSNVMNPLRPQQHENE